MKKVKKYIYPFIFSAVFLILYVLLAFLFAVVIHFPHGSYAPAALLVLFTLAWVMIILPIYCTIYSKIILNEKFKYLFAAYNCLILCVAHILPFNLHNEQYIAVAFLVWVIIWNTVPLLLRLISFKNKGKPSHSANLLLQSPKKTIPAICITCIYIITLITNPMVWHFYVPRSFLYYTLPLISAVLVLVFLFSKNTEYLLKKWLLSFALAGELISSLFLICSSLSSLELQLKHPVNFICSCLMVILTAVMFIGTLFDFKYINMLKYGALGYAVLSVGLLIFNLITVSEFAYQQIDLNGTLAINTSLVMESLIRALYFIGIFIITTNKRSTDLV